MDGNIITAVVSELLHPVTVLVAVNTYVVLTPGHAVAVAEPELVPDNPTDGDQLYTNDGWAGLQLPFKFTQLPLHITAVSGKHIRGRGRIVTVPTAWLEQVPLLPVTV